MLYKIVIQIKLYSEYYIINFIGNFGNKEVINRNNTEKQAGKRK